MLVPNFCWAITSKTSNVLLEASSAALPVGLGFLCLNLLAHKVLHGFSWAAEDLPPSGLCVPEGLDLPLVL